MYGTRSMKKGKKPKNWDQVTITCHCGANNYSTEVIFGCWSCGARLEDKHKELKRLQRMFITKV